MGTSDMTGALAGGEEHGGHGPALARSLGVEPAAILDLSATLNPFAPDVSALVRSFADEVGRYPDASFATEALAEAIGVDADRLVLTNGGAEAIALVASLLPIGDVGDPEFSLYRRHLARVEQGAPRWRSNPNNPLGALADPGDDAAVWDEAFYPLATGEWTRGDDRAWRVGSLTKVWACPGLRMGYVIAPDADAARSVRGRQPAWSVNALACAAIPTLLEQTDLLSWAKQLGELRDALVAVLDSGGHRVVAHDAPWVLVPDADELRPVLARGGIATRECSSFAMPGTIRIAVPDDDGLARIVAALDVA